MGLSLTLALPGCKTIEHFAGSGDRSGTTASTTSGPTTSTRSPRTQLTAAEKQLRDDESRFQKTVIGGVLTGAAVGAVVGGLAALLGGGDSRDAKRGAVAGAVVGGAMGGIDGYVTAKREASGNNELRAIQAATNDVRIDNEKLQTVVNSSNQVLAEAQTRLSNLREDVQQRRISAQDAETERRREEANVATMRKALANARTTRDQYAQASQSFRGTADEKRNLDAEIARANRQIADLERNISSYTRAIAVSRA